MFWISSSASLIEYTHDSAHLTPDFMGRQSNCVPFLSVAALCCFMLFVSLSLTVSDSLRLPLTAVSLSLFVPRVPSTTSLSHSLVHSVSMATSHLLVSVHVSTCVLLLLPSLQSLAYFQNCLHRFCLALCCGSDLRFFRSWRADPQSIC